MPPAKTKKSTTTSAKSWKSQKVSSAAVDLELPSGNVAKVKRPGLTKMLAENILPSTITEMAQSAAAKGKGTRRSEAQQLDNAVDEIIADPKRIGELFDIFDRVSAYCVVEPELRYHRRPVEGSGNGDWEDIPDEERDPEILYTDEVDLDDKAEVFEFAVGGVPARRELEEAKKFRGESATNLADVPAVADMVVSTE